MSLYPDLTTGVLPISAAAMTLAQCITQTRTTKRPIVITQKGRPTAVIISVPMFAALRRLVDQQNATDVRVKVAALAQQRALIPPSAALAESISVTNHQHERVVVVMFLDPHDTVYRLHLPYRLDGGRAYTFASGLGMPTPTLTINDGMPHEIDGADANAFAAWCKVADAELIDA